MQLTECRSLSQNFTTNYVCPKESLCSEGAGQIFLLVIARTTAFALYVAMGCTFISKCHSFQLFASGTILEYYWPIERLHKVRPQWRMSWNARLTRDSPRCRP